MYVLRGKKTIYMSVHAGAESKWCNTSSQVRELGLAGLILIEVCGFVWCMNLQKYSTFAEEVLPYSIVI